MLNKGIGHTKEGSGNDTTIQFRAKNIFGNRLEYHVLSL